MEKFTHNLRPDNFQPIDDGADDVANDGADDILKRFDKKLSMLAPDQNNTYKLSQRIINRAFKDFEPVLAKSFQAFYSKKGSRGKNSLAYIDKANDGDIKRGKTNSIKIDDAEIDDATLDNGKDDYNKHGRNRYSDKSEDYNTDSFGDLPVNGSKNKIDKSFFAAISGLKSRFTGILPDGLKGNATNNTLIGKKLDDNKITGNDGNVFKSSYMQSLLAGQTNDRYEKNAFPVNSKKINDGHITEDNQYGNNKEKSVSDSLEDSVYKLQYIKKRFDEKLSNYAHNIKQENSPVSTPLDYASLQSLPQSVPYSGVYLPQNHLSTHNTYGILPEGGAEYEASRHAAHGTAGGGTVNNTRIERLEVLQNGGDMQALTAVTNSNVAGTRLSTTGINPYLFDVGVF